MRFLIWLTGVLLLGAAVIGGAVYVSQRQEVADPVAIAPARLASDVELNTDRSVINVPFAIPLARVEREINAQIPDELLRMNEERRGCINQQVDLLIAAPTVRIDCRIRGVIRKGGDLQLAGRGGELVVRLPVSFRFNVEGVDGLVDGVRTQTTGSIEVVARVTPRLERDWDFAVNMRPNFRWTERATTRIMGFDFDFSAQLRPEIQKALDGMVPEIRRMLEEANVRQLVARAWRQLQEPQRVSQNPNVWLVMNPRQVLFSGLQIQRNFVRGQVALVADTETRVGGRPEVREPRELPNLRQMDEDLSRGFDVSIPVTINYGLIERALEQARLGNRIARAVDPGQYTLKLSGFDVYPSGASLTIGFDFEATTPGGVGDAEGRAYVSAVPEVDWNRQTLRLTQMQFVSVADNAVVNAATFLIGQRPVMELAERSAWISFANEFDVALESVNAALTQDLGQGLTTRGRLHSAEVADLAFTEEGVRVVVTLGGQLRVDIAE